MDQRAELLGDSPGIDLVRRSLRRLIERQREGQRLPPVLIQGDTGTGKGLVARMLHRHGARAKGPFIDVNCAAIPETLLEAELFGFERGAFTDAHRAKPGLFQAAHRGVLFLDEVGLLPEILQAKLLSAIEERAVRRLGSTIAEPADAWLISATNTDLKGAVRARKFREDLYHRLAVVTIDLPPLCDRGRDIVFLAERFLARACEEYGLPPKRLESAAQDCLLAYSWPGNVRELANVIERAALFADGAVITADALGVPAAEALKLRAMDSELRPVPLGGRDELTQQRLVAALEETGWNISHTAARLGVARNTVYARLEKFGLKLDAADKLGGSAARRGEPVAVPPTPDTSLRWERRAITLLRAEICGSDNVDAWSQSSRALEAVIAKMQSFGGRLEEMSPTGLVAAFGVDAFDDAPRRAAHAALAIHRDGQRARDSGGTAAPVTVGLHVASVLIGRVEARVEINVQDKRGHWPALEELIREREPDATFVSAAAEPFLERRFELTPLERGADRQERVYRLTGRERHGLALWGATTRFVGRQDELAALQVRFRTAASGHGEVVAVVGEAGVGKSRLVFELARSQHVAGCLVLETGSVPYGKGSSYFPVTGLLRRYFGIEDRDTHREIRDRVVRKLAALDPALGAVVPAFLMLLDTPTDDPQWQRLDPSQRRKRTFDAVKRLLRHESEIQPILMIFEDLHWIDSETQALLDAIVGSLPTMPVLLVVTYRPEYQHVWASQSYYTHLRIDPLPVDCTEELLVALLGGDASLEPLRGLLADKAGRNPLFIEESVRTLVETGVLRGQRGAYTLAQSVDAVEVPATVQAILAARIDRLPADDKQLLEIAAVIGKEVPFALLRTVVDEGDEAIRDGLERLQMAEFLYETRAFADAAYTFKHALTHEVTYESVLSERRKALHTRIVDAIERCYQDRLIEHVEQLAYHAIRGEMWEKAVTYFRQAGVRAFARSANRDAVASFEQALTALQHLPPSRETLEQTIDLRFDLRTAFFPLAEFERIFVCLREAEGLARTLDDQRRLGQMSVYMCHNHWVTGHPTEALEFGQRAQAIAESLADVPLQVTANLYFGVACLGTGGFGQAERLFLRVLRLLEGDLSRERFGLAGFPAVMARCYLTWVFAEQGKFNEGIIHGQEGIRLAEALDHPFSLAFGCWILAVLRIARGDLVDAVGLLDRGLALSREWNLTFYSVNHTASLGHAYALAGRAAEGIPLLEHALSAVETMGLGSVQPVFLRYVGEAYVLAGRLEDALEVAERALSFTRGRGHRGYEAWARWLLGEVTARRDSPEHADVHYRGALAVSKELGMRPLVAHCHLSSGKLYRRTGQREQAREHLTSAATMYREMGMKSWLDRAEAELSSAL